MTDLKNPRVIYAKGMLFFLCGVLAGLLVLAEHPTLKVFALLTICVWCFARSYYFAFYVIEHYVDGEFRYAGLGSFLRYLTRKRANDASSCVED